MLQRFKQAADKVQKQVSFRNKRLPTCIALVFTGGIGDCFRHGYGLQDL